MPNHKRAERRSLTKWRGLRSTLRRREKAPLSDPEAASGEGRSDQVEQRLRELERMQAKLARSARLGSFQLESLIGLHSLVQPVARVPPRPKWAAAPDLVLAVVEAMRQLRPSLVIECGSGWSTLWLALAVRRFELDGRIVALEHAPEYAHRTQELLESHNATEFAEVRVAPLEPLELDGQEWRWYARKAWDDLEKCGVLLVDGPPGKSSGKARYPAIPALATRLETRIVVALDDARRRHEREIVQAWLELDLGFSTHDTELAKGASILYRGAKPVL